MPPTVLDTIASFLGSGSACTCAWPPNGIWQCLSLSACRPVIIDCGDSVGDTPPAGGKKFNHITEKTTAWMINRVGNTLNGRVVITPLTRFLTVRILCSISGTC
jgi:hypothetical protein